jgi:Leucine-rich repeat (LRR) protein
MPIANASPMASEHRRISVRLPRPLWIGLAAVALIIASLGLRIGLPAYRRHAAMRRLEAAGAFISTYRIGPNWLREFLGPQLMRPFERIYDLNLEVLQAADSDLAPLRSLPDVESLTIYSEEISDAGFENLATLTSLKQLNAGGMRLTDAGLRHLAGLKSLEELDVSLTGVTDAGLAHLTRLTRLRVLDLSYTKITDAGLEILKELPSLDYLDLDGTMVTDAGVAELKRALPDVTIRW